MKKLKFSLVMLVLALVFPLTMVLSGCGATPKNEALGVYFQSYEYDDETGYAVFSVDMDKPTKLDFKVNPSSWSGYAVTYAIKECSANNLSRFKFQDGIITVNSVDIDPLKNGAKFEDIKIEIYVNGYTDTCIVTLKKYPKSVYVVNENVSIGAGTSFTINPIGVFEDAFGATYEKSLIEYEYNFLVETDDETVISVPNKNRLKVVSVRKNNEAAKVYVTLLNTKGESYGDSFKLTINIKVVENASDSRTNISGYNKFVKSGDAIQINASDLSKDGDEYVLSYKNYIFSTQKLLIDNSYVEIECTSNDSRYVDIDSENTQIKVTKGRENKLTFTLSMWSNLTADDGSVFATTFTVTINF